MITDLRSEERREQTPKATAFMDGLRQFAESEGESTPPVDYRSAEDYEQAIDLLSWVEDDSDGGRTHITSHSAEIGAVGKSWRLRAVASLGDKLDRSFRDRMPLRTEQVALAEIKRIALIVKESSEALLSCAERMKSKGDRTGAADAFRAYQRFRDEARALLGGEA
jgi:hypothetical protein